MLDISFIRDNAELVKDAARKRGSSFDPADLLDADDRRRTLLQETDSLRAEQNKANDSISKAEGDEREKMVEEMRTLKEGLRAKEDELQKVMRTWRDLMIKVPNIPDISVPEGKSEEDNRELKEWGEKPSFSFTPKDHIELMTALGMVDLERGSKVHGFRGYFLRGDGALLSVAVWNYARDFYLRKNFEFFLSPSIVKKEYFYGTGHLPSGADDLYVTQDDDYLSGTAEVPMMAFHADETLKKEDLPKRYLAFSPCYRREAGSYGKDTKGLLRVHEFYKLEQLILCEAGHDVSVGFHEELNRNMEEFVESLMLPYRQLVMCTGDLKESQVKCYDTELWIPSQNTYREIGSASYYHDFQARRFNIRYTDGNSKFYVHSLNGTAIPTPRILIALVENNQQADGSVVIPEALRPYMGGREKIEARS